MISRVHLSTRDHCVAVRTACALVACAALTASLVETSLAGPPLALDAAVAATAGGQSSGGTITLGFTVGETVVGLSLAPSAPVTQIAGFWGVGSGAVLGVEDERTTVARDRIALTAAPNPFTTGTRFELQIPEAARSHAATVRIFDANGRLVRALALPRDAVGRQSLAWDGRDHSGRRVPVGLYLGLVEAGPFRERRRVAHLE